MNNRPPRTPRRQAWVGDRGLLAKLPGEVPGDAVLAGDTSGSARENTRPAREPAAIDPLDTTVIALRALGRETAASDPSGLSVDGTIRARRGQLG
jgi:hypothetical protein